MCIFRCISFLNTQCDALHTDSSPHSRRFEQLCVYDVLRCPTFQTYIAECLSFDFVCKQDYPKDMILPLADYLFWTNLYHCSLTGLSKYRLVKQQKINKVRYSTKFVRELEERRKSSFKCCLNPLTSCLPGKRFCEFDLLMYT